MKKIGEQHERAHLEELALPVLGRCLQEVPGREVLAERGLGLAMGHLIRVVLLPPSERHRRPEGQEQSQADKTELAVAKPPSRIA